MLIINYTIWYVFIKKSEKMKAIIIEKKSICERKFLKMCNLIDNKKK